MLDRIEISNFATIEAISLDLGSGLNIITGETGAGKSVLVEAISTALGGRADMAMLRSGAEKAVIQLAGSFGGEDFILTRELLSSGRSLSKINGELVPLAQLRTYCARLADIHGQYDNQEILNPENHLGILDRFRHEHMAEPLAELRARHRTYHEAKQAYDALLREENESRQQEAYRRFEHDHIAALRLKPGEDERLHEQLEYMKNGERIYAALSHSVERLQGGQGEQGDLLSGLGSCLSALQPIAAYRPDLSQAAEELADIYYRLEDLAHRLQSLRGSMSFSQEKLDSVSARLSSIEDAKRKYRRSIDEILAYQKTLEEQLALAEHIDEEKAKRRATLQAAREALLEQADLVSGLRRENADILAAAMRRELADLAFANAAFAISVDALSTITAQGRDRVSFLISTNPGEPLRPLDRIASGGEISRIMLAFRHIIGDDDQMETLIFDEIDSGISGQTALVVGSKLREIAAHHQILCITHLPQIAACGDEHFAIEKVVASGTSHTEITHLDPEAKLHSLAQLISGDADSASALETARELIEQVKAPAQKATKK